MTSRPGDAASVSVFVPLEPAEAFEVFTAEIDAWWRRGPRFRGGGAHASRMTLEPGVGGRLLESVDGARGTRTIEFGRVTRWEPGTHLALEWRNVNFTAEQKTLVEVSFRPSNDGTLVTVRHSGWSALPDDHPARHGHVGADHSRFLGLWWADLASALREHVSARR